MMALAGRVRPVTLRAACCGRASPSWCRVPGRDGTGSARQPPAKRVVTAAARRAQAWPAPEVRSLPRGERQLAWASRRAWSVCTVTGVSSGHVRGLRSGELETWSGLHNASMVTGSSLPVPGTCGSQHGNHHELGNYILGAEPVPTRHHTRASGVTPGRDAPVKASDVRGVLARLRCSRSVQRRGVPAQRVADLELIAAHARVVDFQGPAGWAACQAHDPQQCHARVQSQPARFSG